MRLWMPVDQSKMRGSISETGAIRLIPNSGGLLPSERSYGGRLPDLDTALRVARPFGCSSPSFLLF